MKKNKLTYGLLALVLALWVLIFYRVFSGVAADPPPPPSPVELPAPRPSPPPQGSDSLILAYRDPFLMDTPIPAEDTEYTDMDEGYTAEYWEADPMPYVDWTAVRYFGVVRNGNRAVALLSIHGRDYMLRVGDTAEDYTLVSCTDREATISHHGQQGVVMVQHGQEIESQSYMNEQ